MSEVIAVWDTFDGGHWGNIGPIKAQPNQWGGQNVTVDGQGRLAPVSNFVSLTVANTPSTGQLMGMFWAWGSDGRVYYVQNRTGSTTTSIVYRFSPDPTASNTITTVTTLTYLSSVAPDWALVADELYMTLYSNKTYRIAISGNTTSALAGTYGNAPAGRCIALYGERLVVGGVKDARFGNVPNRIVFSGDDTNNNPVDRTAWETLNYFDVGPPDAVITGLYATRDYLTVVMADQTVYTVTGVLGSTAVARRMNGYAKGSGAIESFAPSHGVVDPSQTKVWMFDHATNGVQRFNGASTSRLPGVGRPRQDRAQSTVPYGDLVALGGSDEFLAFGVEVGAEGGSKANRASTPLTLVRKNSMNSIVKMFSDVNTGFNGFGPNRVVANDRAQVVICTDDGGLDTNPKFEYWYAGAPQWDGSVLFSGGDQADDVPYYASGGLSQGSSLQFPYKRPQKTNIEWEIDGFLVDFIPRPADASNYGWDLGSTTSTNTVVITGYAVGDGIPAFSRSAASATSSGVYSTSALTWSSTYGAGASDIWPNVRTAFFPARMSRVRAARVVLSSVKDARIVSVTLMGKQVPGRTV